MMDRLCKLESQTRGLEVRYWEYAFTNHLFILERETHGEVVTTLEEITIHDEISPKNAKREFPGVYIKSKEVSEKARLNFEANWRSGTCINSPHGREIIEGKKRILRRKMGLKGLAFCLFGCRPYFTPKNAYFFCVPKKTANL